MVTGGASGIGLAAAAAARRTGRRGGRPRPRPLGRRGTAARLKADVTDDASVRSAVAEAVERLGGLDILVNNAGIGAIGTVEDNPDDSGTASSTSTSSASVRVSPRRPAASAALVAHAAIVNTCSIAATAGLPQRALYSASKGAVLSLTLAMAADHVREGIRVNCVNPGTADTPWVGRLLDAADDPEAERAALNARQPLGRLVTADEVAAAIVYLASPAAASVTGTALAVDGGMRLRSGDRGGALVWGRGGVGKEPPHHSVERSHCSTLAMCTVAQDRAASASRSRSAARIARCSCRVRLTASSWVSPRQTRARVVGPESPSSSEQSTELPDARTMPPVELQVAGDQLLHRRAAAPSASSWAVERVQFAVADPRGRHRRRGRLQDPADLEELQHRVVAVEVDDEAQRLQQQLRVEAGDVGAVALPHVQDPDQRQRADRLAQRVAGQPELGGEVALLGQPVARAAAHPRRSSP